MARPRALKLGLSIVLVSTVLQLGLVSLGIVRSLLDPLLIYSLLGLMLAVAFALYKGRSWAYSVTFWMLMLLLLYGLWVGGAYLVASILNLIAAVLLAKRTVKDYLQRVRMERGIKKLREA